MDLATLLSIKTPQVTVDSDDTPLITPLPTFDINSLPPIAPAVFDSLLSLYLNPTFLSQLASTSILSNTSILNSNLLSSTSSNSCEPIEEIKDTVVKSDGVRVKSPSTKVDKMVPNTDKEGWCRNKKYIAKIDNGFMCILCRKVYGRYNSVSYHVTIYHRNPPIECGMPGCDFTTREARYIHFHKYYRHGIELPQSIDLGSRRCPYCRHVSKSPAMLEKHMARHQMNKDNKKISQISISDTLQSLDNTPLMDTIKVDESHSDTGSPSIIDGEDRRRTEEDEEEEMESATSTEDNDSDNQATSPSTSEVPDNEHICNQCNHRCSSSSLLTQHILSSHYSSNLMGDESIKCLLCSFTTSSPSILAQHTLTSHLSSQ